MARETKLGLLVGLGFIICFAVILENRGRRGRIAPQMPHQMLAQGTAVSNPASSTGADERARDYGRRAAGRSKEKAEANSSQPASARDESPPRNRRRAQGRQRLPNGRSTASRRNPDRTQTDRRVGAEAEAANHSTGAADRFSRRHNVAQMTPPATPDTNLPAEPETVAAGPVDRQSAGDVARTSLTATTPGAASPPRTVPAGPAADIAGRRYQVKQGDTLSRIAAEQYGSRSKRIVDAIFDVNRATLSSPDVLKLGQELVLPKIEGAGSPEPRPAGDSGEQGGSAPSPKQDQQYQHYQIKKGDRYATIAKEQLGDARRWKEIAELNRDIFPDPQRIRYGVRIRLPVDSGPRAAGSRS